MRRLLFLTIFLTVLISPSIADSHGQLLLNEISPWPSNGDVFVELVNPGDSAVTLDGYTIEFLSGFTYTFPEDSGDIPSGGIHVLNITGGNPLNLDGDGCTLTSPDGLVDELSWGFPEHPIGNPIRRTVEILDEDEEYYLPDDVCIRYPTSLSPENERIIGSVNWTVRTVDEASPGEPNPMPGPTAFKPYEGTRIASDFTMMVLGLDHAETITFQIATDENFTDILLEITVEDYSYRVEDLPGGDYFWRSRADDGPWHPVHQFSKMDFTIEELIERAEAEAVSESNPDPDKIVAGVKSGGPSDLHLASTETCLGWRVLGVPHIRQHKDTDMVCIDGCEMEGFHAWDSPHNPGSSLTGDHNPNYCFRASTAMMAAFGGATLSQDRVSYYVFQEAGSASLGARTVGHLDDPFGDLGHDMGIAIVDIIMTLNWLYSSTGARHTMYSASVFDDGDRSDMDTIVDFIEAGRPVHRTSGPVSNKHSTVIDGYAIVQLAGSGAIDNYIRVVDPWNANDIEWDVIGMDGTRSIQFPPSGGSVSRRDEPTIDRDSDGDGLCDFDEIERFETDPNESDSDGDGLDDKTDMLGYLFQADGTYDQRDPDIDGDGAWKERDPDNDRAEDNGMNDGCEDVDGNGFFRSGAESDCFDGDDDFTVPNIECFSGIMKIEAHGEIDLGITTVPFTCYEEIVLEEGVATRSTGFDHEHNWNVSGTTSMTVGMTTITVCSDGEGQGTAQLRINVNQDGSYRIVTDTNPRSGTYFITGGGEVNTYPLFFGFADHHYDYVSPEAPPMAWTIMNDYGKPNIFTGQIQRTPEGNLRLKDDDTYTLTMVNLTSSIFRSWDIIIEGP